MTSGASLVDLTATLRFPGLPDTESPAELASAAVAGGFGTVTLAPVGPLIGADALLSFARTVEEGVRTASAPSPVRFVFAPSPVRVVDGSVHGVGKSELAEIYTLARAGVPVRALRLLSPVDDALLLRRVFELARALGVVVMVPSTDKALAHGAVLVESAVSTRLGLPAVPEVSETIGVARAIELARVTRARVHIAQLFTASGVELVAQAEVV